MTTVAYTVRKPEIQGLLFEQITSTCWSLSLSSPGRGSHFIGAARHVDDRHSSAGARGGPLQGVQWWVSGTERPPHEVVVA